MKLFAGCKTRFLTFNNLKLAFDILQRTIIFLQRGKVAALNITGP